MVVLNIPLFRAKNSIITFMNISINIYLQLG